MKKLQIELTIVTQRDEANMVIPASAKLPSPHWSDDIMIKFLDVYDPALEQALKGLFPTAVFTSDPDHTICLIEVESRDNVIIYKDSFESIGYMLEEDINIKYSGRNLDYHMTRWNEDRSDTLLYAEDIKDDYFIVELDFGNEIINQDLIVETITNNINYYRHTDIVPDLDFEWLEDKNLLVTVTNMIDDTDYAISLNGYLTDDGTTHYTWSTCHGYIGYLEEYYDGYYDFTKLESDSAKCIEYNSNTEVVTEIGTINHYDYYIGASAGNFVNVALPDEYGFYSYIYDMDTNKIYDYGLHSSYYHDSFEYNDDLYITHYNGISRVEADGSLTVVYQFDSEDASIYTVRKHPEKDMFSMLYDRNYKDCGLITLDGNFDVISDVDIEFYRLGFYGIFVEIYWLDHDTVLTTDGSEDEFNTEDINTKAYNIYTGETEHAIENEKIMTISDNGKYVLTQDWDNGKDIKIYNQDLEFQYELTIETTSYNSSYQYMDYWLDNILYIKYYDTNEVYKLDLETYELTILNLPYEDFLIDEVLEEDVFRLFIDIKMINRSNAYWS